MNTPDVTVDHGGIEELKTPRPPSLTAPKVATGLATVEAQKLILALGLTTELAQAVVPVLIRNLITLEKKQRDYGPHNLTKFGTFGVVVRMGDKMERIVNLSKKCGSLGLAYQMAGDETLNATTNNEPIADSFLDLANYALIAYVMQQNLWPDESR